MCPPPSEDLVDDLCDLEGCGEHGYRWLDAQVPGEDGELVEREMRLCTRHWWLAYRSPDRCPLDVIKRRLTDDQVAEIRWAHEQGHTVRAIAETYGVGKTTVHNRLTQDYQYTSPPPPEIREQLERWKAEG